MNKAISIVSLFVVCSCFFSCKKKSSNDGTISENQRIIEGEFRENRGSCGLVPVQDMYCSYTDKVHSSKQYFDLIISLVN